MVILSRRYLRPPPRAQGSSAKGDQTNGIVSRPSHTIINAFF